MSVSELDLSLTAAIFQELSANHAGLWLLSFGHTAHSDHALTGGISRDALWGGLSDSGLTDRQIEHLFFNLDTEEYNKVSAARDRHCCDANPEHAGY